MNAKAIAGDMDGFLGVLRSHLRQRTCIRLILSKYRGREPDLRSIVIRPIVLKGQGCLSFARQYATQDITRNFPQAEGVQVVRDMLGQDFKSGHLFTATEEVQIDFSKKGKCKVSRKASAGSVNPDSQHDRTKQRLIKPDRPFLQALGVTNAQHQVLPSMSRKWKQINVFLEHFQNAFAASPLVGENSVHVVDFGAGKGYLTFAIHDYLRETLRVGAQVTGVEVRPELVRLCNDVATKLRLDTLRFCHGDVQSYRPEKLHVLIALHACDTATDQALYLGIRSGASILMCAPCCHKELRPQMRSPPVLQPMLRFGTHLGEEAEMVTDSLRALLLEAAGYETQVFEFISLEHTSKNKMILAVKGRKPSRSADAQAQVRALKEFYGIRTQRLEALLLGG